MEKSKSWLIVGLGWLGEELKDKLQSDGFSVQGTHRSEFDLRHHAFPKGDWDVVFLNTPPLLELSPKSYAERVTHIQAGRVIFISSTSVYGAGCGEVTEADPVSPDSAGGKWLAETEAQLAGVFGERLQVIRPGGLIGGKRHPVFHLQGRLDVKGGDERVNLIHRTDLVSIIRRAPEWARVINAIAPAHPTKAQYYTEWAQRLGLVAPQFGANSGSQRLIQSQVLPEFYAHWVCPNLDSL